MFNHLFILINQFKKKQGSKHIKIIKSVVPFEKRIHYYTIKEGMYI